MKTGLTDVLAAIAAGMVLAMVLLSLMVKG